MVGLAERNFSSGATSRSFTEEAMSLKRQYQSQDLALTTVVLNLRQQSQARLPSESVLASARQQLSLLLSEEIPALGALPPGSRMPFRIPPPSTGQTQVLKTLASTFHHEQGSLVPSAAILGPAGVGKSQLARELVYRYGRSFVGGVFWLNASDAELFTTEVARCGGMEGLDFQPDFASLPLTEQAQLVFAAWRSPLPRLLVFDDFQGDAPPITWLPASGSYRILFTSRDSQWASIPGVVSVFMEALSPSQEQAPKPFALLSAQTRVLLEHATLFAPGEPIPLSLLAASLTEAGMSPSSLQDMVDVLVDVGWLEWSTSADVILPRGVVPLLQQQAGNEAYAAVAQAVLDLGQPLLEAEKIMPLHGWSRHLQHLTDTARERADARTAQLCIFLASYLEREGDRRASFYFGEALCIQHQVLGTYHAETASTLHRLGVHHHRRREYTQARSYYEQALAVREQVLGRSHLNTAQCYYNLATLCSDEANYPEAQVYYETSLAIRRECLEPRHPDVLHTLVQWGNSLEYQNDVEGATAAYRAVLTPAGQTEVVLREQALALGNLGSLYHSQGLYEAARVSYEQALEIQSACLGFFHTDSAHTLANLGTLFFALGDPYQARLCLERALLIRRYLHGETHPDIAKTLTNLGALLQEEGHIRAAELYYEHALAIFHKVQTETCPELATTYHNLGVLCQSQGRVEEAHIAYEQALLLRQSLLGHSHPLTLSTLQQWGSLYKAQQDWESARVCYEAVLTQWRMMWGSDHPETALAASQVASLLKAQGKYSEAEAFYREALSSVQRSLGEGHETTAILWHNLATVLEAKRDFEAAVACYGQALTIQRALFGEQDVRIATTLHCLGDLFLTTGESKVAVLRYEQALAVRRQHLGDFHSDTIQTLNNLAVSLHHQGRLAEARACYAEILAGVSGGQVVLDPAQVAIIQHHFQGLTG